MTEEEAKTKWCPHAVASHTDPRAGFRDDGRPKVHPCIGSACMAWRWNDVPNPEYDRQRHVFMGGYPPSTTPPMTVKSETEGHCGLAGRP